MTRWRFPAAFRRWRGQIRAASLMRRLSSPDDPLAALLLDDAGGAALVVDRAGQVVRANDALRQMLDGGLAPTGSAEPLFHAPLREAAWEEIRLVLQGRSAGARSFASALCGGGADQPGGQPVRVSVLPLKPPQSSMKGASMKGASVTGATVTDATVTGALLRFTDISGQRQLEAQLAHSQKLQATGQLAGGIAHDFNNLLTAILGAAEGIIDADPAADIAEDALQIRASAQRGAALVRQLLAFGRQQTLQPRILAVNEVITDLSGLLRRLLGSQIRLELALEEPGRMVRADPTQVDQVLVNLAVNARDAMPQGGVLTLRSGHITLFRPLAHGVEIIPPGRYVMIEVQDNGRGIAPDILPLVFDPFFTTKREQGGSGLGLSTVHGIVRQSEGFLAVESELGLGTAVRIYLPRWDGAEAVAIPRMPAPPHSPAAAPAQSQRGTILLVDDEDPVRRLAERALVRAGWRVLSADCGEQALALLSDRPPESPPIAALVSDMVMPGMDGTALMQAVRTVCGHPDLPVVLVSGYAESPLRGGLMAANALFLAKPYSLADLVAAVDRAMARVISS